MEYDLQFLDAVRAAPAKSQGKFGIFVMRKNGGTTRYTERRERSPPRWTVHNNIHSVHRRLHYLHSGSAVQIRVTINPRRANSETWVGDHGFRTIGIWNVGHAINRLQRHKIHAMNRNFWSSVLVLYVCKSTNFEHQLAGNGGIRTIQIHVESDIELPGNDSLSQRSGRVRRGGYRNFVRGRLIKVIKKVGVDPQKGGGYAPFRAKRGSF